MRALHLILTQIVYDMKKVWLLLAVVWVATSCKPTVQVQGQEFGEVVSMKKTLTYDQMIAQVEKKGGLENVQVEGTVSDVCQAKGCWMTIVSEKEGAQVMTVKFKDYGFFMPKDIAGKTVVMQGNAYIEETSVDELRHYAEDAGKSQDEIMSITEPKVELKFLATGVILKEKA